MPRKYRLGHRYRFLNPEMGIDYTGPLEAFFIKYQDHKPDGGEIAQLLGTQIERSELQGNNHLTIESPDELFTVERLAQEMENCSIDWDRKWNVVIHVLSLGTLLRFGAAMGEASVVERAIAAGVDVNGQGAFGMTAAHWASACDRPITLKQLIDAGANVRVENEMNWNILDLAIMNQSRRCREIVLSLELGERAGEGEVRAMKRWGMLVEEQG